jgi:hypothetical protein
MIRHIALFKWTAETTQEQKEAAATEIAKLPSIIPSVRGFASGPDAGLGTQGNFDFAVTADFDEEAGFRAYRDDPGHREMVQRYLTPFVADRAAVQFEF